MFLTLVIWSGSFFVNEARTAGASARYGAIPEPD